MSDQPQLWVPDEPECGHRGCLEDNVAGLNEYGHPASAADLVEAVFRIEGAEKVGWCVVHRDTDAARPDTDDVRQVCGGSLFWSTGKRGDCSFVEAVVVMGGASR